MNLTVNGRCMIDVTLDPTAGHDGPSSREPIERAGGRAGPVGGRRQTVGRSDPDGRGGIVQGRAWQIKQAAGASARADPERVVPSRPLSLALGVALMMLALSSLGVSAGWVGPEPGGRCRPGSIPVIVVQEDGSLTARC